MSKTDDVRGSVRDAYKKAVQSESPSGCCGGSPAQKGVVVKLAGYGRDELSALPDEAVVNSFGCGNPLAYSGVEKGDVVLDLGSGAGIDILIAGKMVGPEGGAIGIDMTDEMIEKACKNIAASGLTNVDVRKGIIEEMPVDSSTVDWVISNCVINLSPEKPRVFSEIARVLKPGGRMLVSDIVVKELPDWVRGHEALYCSCIAGAISEEEYIAGLEAAGLVNIEVRERLVYDATQLKAFVESELPDNQEAVACCGGGISPEMLERAVETLQGQIWSAKIYAEKPTA